MILDTYTVNVRFNTDRASFANVDKKLRQLSKKAANLKIKPTLERANTRNLRSQLNKLKIKPTLGRLNVKTLQNQLDQLHIRPKVVGTGAGVGSGDKRKGSVPTVAGSSLKSVAGVAGGIAAGSGAVGFLKSSVEMARQFELSMAKANNVLKATNEEQAQLEKLAKQIGETTAISAVEAATGIEMLAKNGLKADQIMGGALETSVKLALAMGVQLGPVADLATDVMANFNIKAEDMEKSMNTLVGATFSSKFGFEDMRYAVASVGGVAGKVGVDFDELATALALTSSAFSGGSDAGTSMKTFLISLAPKTKAAAQAMDALGFSAFDADGKMRPMRDIVENLHQGFSKMSEEQKISTAATIFGTDAMRTALSIADQGGAAYDRYTASIAKASIEETKLAMNNTLDGKIKQLTSAWEGFKLSLVDAGALDAIKGLVLGMTEFVKVIKDAGDAWDVMTGKGIKSKLQMTKLSKEDQKLMDKIKKDSGQAADTQDNDIGSSFRGGVKKVKSLFGVLGNLGDAKTVMSGGDIKSNLAFTKNPTVAPSVPTTINIKQTNTNVDPKVVEDSTKAGVKKGMTESLAGNLNQS